MKTMLFSLKEYSIGLAIFLIPVISFMSHKNLRQLGSFDLYLILTSLIAVLIVLLIFSTFLQFTIIKIFKTRPHSILLLSCFGFYLLFLFTPIYEIVIVSIFQKGNAVYFTLLFLFLIWLTTLVLVLHFQKFAALFQRSMFIFACINILYSLIFNTEFVTKIWNKSNILKQETQSLLEFEDSDLLRPVNKSDNHNVYYIILDEMMALDYAANMGFVDKVKQKEVLEQAGLTYIDQSYSNYDITSHTLASIMEINYPALLHSASMKTSMVSRIFSYMMQQKDKRIPLPDLISKTGSEFLWVGNAWSPCAERTTQPWTCIHLNKLRNLFRLSNTIYLGTPLKRILELTHFESGQRNIKLYIEFSKKNKKTNNLQFVFIHQFSPHHPYTVTENCKQQVASVINFELKNWEQRYKEGYKASYRCVLKEVLEFMEYISTADPGAIVVFQGDHGFKVVEDKAKTPEDIFHYKAAIFNSIKAPEICFKKFGEPHSNINTVRFILNCAYGYEFSYLPSIHYPSNCSPSTCNKPSLLEASTFEFQP